MIEEERLNYVEKVNKLLKEKEQLEAKEEELKKQMEKEEVKKYFALLEEVNSMKNYSIESLEHVRGCAFARRLRAPICNHDIWVWDASYCDSEWAEKPYWDWEKFEKAKGFIYNEYHCLDCGEYVKEEDWEDFEREHTVLKDRKLCSHHHFLDVYPPLYEKLLYEYPADVAINKLVEQFQKDALNNSEEKKKMLVKEGR